MLALITMYTPSENPSSQMSPERDPIVFTAVTRVMNNRVVFYQPMYERSLTSPTPHRSIGSACNVVSPAALIYY
jgi:hypothetical protein